MMTHDEIIAVVTAHRDGKAVEFRSFRTGNEWRPLIEGPVWNFALTDYRIKPEPQKPREWWISSHRGFTAPAYPNEASARAWPLAHEVIHVREVLPESQA